ncbi:MAG: magnesium and cobalt transport protein CorA [Alphaproteobacteria bacterium PRO2]|nr:magnesium and cobalt transport protein CorA [Alphaproteobacteria bacterium PRO2]
MRKTRLLYKAHPKAGLAPGTLQAPKGAVQPVITVFAYDVDGIEEPKIDSVADIEIYRRKWPMIWVNVDGLADAKVIAELGEMFGLHALALEDVLHIPQRAKVEEYENHMFATLRMVRKGEDVPSLEQISMFWGKNYLLTFQEDIGDVFNGVRERLRKGGKRTRMAHADYMAYALIDAIVDGYFPVLESYGDRIDELEEIILEDPAESAMAHVHKIRRELHALRLCVWPIREALSRINADTKLVRKETLLFLRDCHDHVIQILDIIENYRDRLSSLSDLYFSSISTRMNEVIKVLTVITTIFMPLTFIVGVYGMNFNTDYPANMPELNHPHGYVIVMSVMLVIFVGMLIFFWNLGWLDTKKSLAELEEEEAG